MKLPARGLGTGRLLSSLPSLSSCWASVGLWARKAVGTGACPPYVGIRTQRHWPGGERRGLCEGRCGVAGVQGSGFGSSLWGDPAGPGSPWPIPDTMYQTCYNSFESPFFV